MGGFPLESDKRFHIVRNEQCPDGEADSGDVGEEGNRVREGRGLGQRASVEEGKGDEKNQQHAESAKQQETSPGQLHGDLTAAESEDKDEEQEACAHEISLKGGSSGGRFPNAADDEERDQGQSGGEEGSSAFFGCGEGGDTFRHNAVRRPGRPVGGPPIPDRQRVKSPRV